MGNLLDRHSQIEQCLHSLQLAMQSAELWSDTAPPVQAMNSNMPFAVDTLDFAQWLQFIFIPKMTALLMQAAPLPHNLNILPMAEEAFGHHTNTQAVLTIIAKLEQFVSQQGSR